MFQPSKLADLISRKAEPKSDPHSLSAFIAWMERQDPATKYEWMNCHGGCLIDMYLRAIGIKDDYPTFVRADADDVLQSIASTTFHGGDAIAGTIGAALTRARAYQAAQS